MKQLSMSRTQHIATHSQQTIPLAYSLISAGPASEVGEDFKLLDVCALITGNREGFIAYEVTGVSGVPTIRHGALVFIDTWAEPQNGNVIAAMVNGLVCVKIFRHSPRGLYLVSKNPDYKPRKVTADDAFTVLGVVKFQLEKI